MQGKAVRRIALVLCIVILIASCSRESVDNSGFSVVAVGFPSYDAARAVMKGAGEPYMLLPPGVETHSYDPNPKDMTAVAEADPGFGQLPDENNRKFPLPTLVVAVSIRC